MDGVSGAASIVAVIGFALSSTKIVHDTISGIKDGPNAILQTNSALEDLRKILEQIEALDAGLTSINANLQNVIRKCATELKAFENKIGCLRILPTDKKLGKAWKRVKTMIKQDDFQNMWHVINRHVSALGLQLQLIETNIGLAHKKYLHRLDGMLEATALTTSVEFNNSFKNQIETLERVEALSSGVERLSNMSEVQAQKMKAAIGLLQDLCITETSQRLRAPNIYDSHETLGADEENGVPDEHPREEREEELRTGLKRLCSLATGKKRTVFSREAQDIIEDVEQLLYAVTLTTKSGNREGRETKRKRKKTSNRDRDEPSDEETECKRGVKRLKGFLATSQCIAVNSNATSDRTRTLGRRYSCRNLLKSYDVGDGTITIHTNSRMLKDSIENAEAQDDDRRNEIVEVFEGAIEFLPNSVPNTRFSVSFQQRSTFEGSLLGKPSISFSSTLPDNSAVFLRIKDDDMEGLLKLLVEGAASLTDRDPRGRSLLNYAYTFSALDVCKFLIEHGADVDAIEEAQFSPGRFTMSILEVWPNNDIEAFPEDLDLSMACRRVLLEANADPMVGIADEISGMPCSHFLSLLDVGTVESLRLVLDLSRDFIDLEEKDGNGRTALLRLLDWKGTAEKVDLLLRRGANPEVYARDGRSCLHYCVERSETSECVEILKRLIRAGADVHAVDDIGYSVTKCAYNTPEEGHTMRKRGFTNGNRGMIWEQALTDCGYDAAEFRQAHLDAGGHLLGNSQYIDLNSQYDEFTKFGPEGKRLDYADYEKQQYSVGDQDWDFNSVAGVDQVPIIETRPADINLWNWSRSGHITNEDHFNPPPSGSNHHDPQPRTDNTPWSYISTPCQSQAPQPDTCLRTEDLHLLEGDADVWSQ